HSLFKIDYSASFNGKVTGCRAAKGVIDGVVIIQSGCAVDAIPR
ncbi:MAG: hypothetical protein PWP53_4203, partial [Lacrimispora sp.]|nr:hypothetical protein [Lacrimispora sp.]